MNTGINSGLLLHLDAGNSNSYSGSGNTWNDLSPSGNNGIINGATFNSSNKSFDFDGSNDYVGLNAVLSQGQNVYTIEGYFKPDTQQNDVIFEQVQDGGGQHTRAGMLTESDTYRVDSSVPGTYDFVVVNYSKPNNLNKQLKYEVEYITPVMKEMVANKYYGRTGWNVQHKIYPAGSEEKFTMFSVDGYASMADAIKSFDTEYGKDYSSGWNSVIKKVHGKKTMQQSLSNGFAYRPIYKRILRTN